LPVDERIQTADLEIDSSDHWYYGYETKHSSVYYAGALLEQDCVE
jgi:hypothetical protein